MMEHFSHYCQGESHKATDKPCQDCAYSEVTDSFSMGIVCDGHGGERYFRSQEGSRIATEVTKEALKVFVETLPESVYSKNLGKPLFEGMPFIQYSQTDASIIAPEYHKQSKLIHEALSALFASIISQWNIKIALHATEHPLNEWEQEHVEKKYQDEFLSKLNDDTSGFEKTYGCTLMAYLQTKDYWFAFHIGDGKFLRYQMNDGYPVFDQPIPWDEKCFLNKTTSICDTQAVDEFRYCYQGDGQFPEAVFLGSDGMDDSYGDGENLTNFYIQLYKLVAKQGKEKALKELQKSLPLISKRGSKDDMSVVCVYNEENLQNNAFSLVEYQLLLIEKQRDAAGKKIIELRQKIEAYGSPETLSQSDQINLQYATKDLDKAESLEKRLWSRHMNLCKEAKSFNNNEQESSCKEVLFSEEPDKD